MKHPGLTLLFAAGVALAADAVQAQTQARATSAVVAFPDALEWGPAPAILPAGARLAVIEGDPSQPGEFTMRLWMPAGYRLPPHFHPATEHVTVVQGTFYVGMGDRFDESQVSALPTGTFGAIPAGMRHYALTKEVVVIQLHGVGPWSLTYVDPADRPKAR
ncbi:MAG TPA: cupin domain-containing protein [Longimicrobiales bacterium]